MIVYTPDAATALGSANAAQAKAGARIANLNTCLSNSGLNSITATLVHTAQVSQNFGQNGHSAALSFLGSDATVASLRDQYKADCVSIIIQGATIPSGTLGLGSLLMVQGGVPSHQKTSVWHSAPDETFSHEIGHNHGCGHDPGNGNSIFAYARGNYFTGSGTGYRTVMAYQKSGFNTRAPVFSGPSIQYKGGTTGSASADNAKTIGITNPAIQKYK